jgi:hypothetical protein
MAVLKVGSCTQSDDPDPKTSSACKTPRPRVAKVPLRKVHRVLIYFSVLFASIDFTRG